jgi:hypothetical protein
MAQARDQLSLGGITFDAYWTPDILPNGHSAAVTGFS